jgi:hypothetical protein
MFHTALWGLLLRIGRRFDAHFRATRITLWVSRSTAVLGIAYAFLIAESIFLAIIFFWAWTGAERLNNPEQIRAAEGPSLGYDFSRGYTSFDRSWRRRQPLRERIGHWLRRLWPRRRRTAGPAPPYEPPDYQPPPAVDREERERVDAILARISREGIGALTEEERHFLKRMSRRWSRGD